MAATPGPRQPVDAPVAIPPARSLLTAITPKTLDPGAGGVSHVQGRSSFVSTPLDLCSPGNVTVTDACGQGNRNSFAIVAPEMRPSQSTFAAGRVTLDERRTSAVANLDYHKSFRIARELMYGTASVVNGWGNPYLLDPAALTVVSLSAQPYLSALDRIVDAWGKRMQGERGLLHMPPAVAHRLYSTYQIIERGGQLVEPVMGNLVVVDDGYIGLNNQGAGQTDPVATSDPLGQVQWIVMSPNIDIRLSQVDVTPSTEADMAFAVDRATNVLTVRAWQIVSYTYEQPGGTLPAPASNPPVLAIPVDLCEADCVPGSS